MISVLDLGPTPEPQHCCDQAGDKDQSRDGDRHHIRGSNAISQVDQSEERGETKEGCSGHLSLTPFRRTHSYSDTPGA